MDPAQVPQDACPPSRRLLVRLVDGVCRHPRLTLAVCLGVAALSLYGAWRHLEYHTSRNDLISADKDYQQRWQQYLAEFGDDDDMVVVVRGKDPERMEQALETLAARIQARGDLFDRLFYKVDLRDLRGRALLLLGTQEVEQIHGKIQDMRLLLDLGPWSWRGLGLSSLLREAQSRLARLEPGQPLKPEDEQMLGQLAAVCSAAEQTLADPAAYRTPWGSVISSPPQQKDMLGEPQYFFSGDRSLAFLLTRPRKEEGSFTGARTSVEAMREILGSAQGEYPDLEMGLTGMPVLETDEMVAAEADTKLASWIAIIGVTLLYLLVYRGIAYPLITVVTLLVGTAWAMGWAALTVGHLNILSATFAVMLIGMGDYGVLWVMRYEQARRQGADVRTALLHTTVHVAVGNLTAAGTLALAFFMAMFADFKAVAELGWIAGWGVLLCALACFTVLPALMTLIDRRQMAAHPDILPLAGGSPARGWLPWLWPHSRIILAASLLLALVLGWLATRVRYDHNLLNLQAQDLSSVHWEMTLIEHTAGASWHAVSYTKTREEALALKARYERLPEVSQVVEVATLVPADQDRKLKLLRDIQDRLGRLPGRGEAIPHPRPDREHLQGQLGEVLTTLHREDSAPARAAGAPVLEQLRQSVAGLAARLEKAPATEVAESRLQAFDERLAVDLAEDLHRLREVSTPRPITLEDLPESLRSRFVGKNETWLLRVFARDCLWEFAPLEHFTRQIRSVDPEATGKPFGTVEGLKAMKNGLTRAGVYALLVITAVLWLDFRSLRQMLLALMPLVLGVLMSLGLMGLFDMPLNPANMIAFPLILGVGVDNGVHLLHDYQVRRRCGESRQGLVSHAIGRGVLVKTLTTMLGFGSLMVSTERGLASLGFLLALGVGCAMVAALIVLPAALEVGQRAGRAVEPAPAQGETIGLGAGMSRRQAA